MNTAMLLEMAASAAGDRVAVGSRPGGVTYQTLLERAHAAARWLEARGGERTVLVDVNSEAVPILLFGSAIAGRPFVPVNYRLSDEQLQRILARTAPAVVVIDVPVADRIGPVETLEIVRRPAFLDAVGEGVVPAPPVPEVDSDDIAVLLFTSGTTGEPKAAVLRHRHLTSYVISTVDFMSAAEDDAALVSVPPYHVAGISAILTSVFAGRRIVYLPAFEPKSWVAAARDEAVTHAMVVPTMLGRILDALDAEGESLPALRHLSYGGGRMPVAVIERALSRLPHVDFVNAYGLTETSSTIAVLGPDDHRAASGRDPRQRRRLGSVGRPLPTVEVEIRDPLGEPVPAGEVGEIWVRGEQVGGEYLGRKAQTRDGWFPTKDSGMFDDDGYLYVEGRLDDVIVRGGENLSPGQIEDVLRAHPAVDDVCVCGIADTEWGERVVAAVVPVAGTVPDTQELQELVRSRLRSSRAPERILFVDELPYSETGKLLRRIVRQELAAAFGDV